MKTFRLANPKTLAQATALLTAPSSGKSSSIKVLAGGQDLLTEMKEYLAEPDTLVNLKGVPGLDSIAESGGAFTIGALTTIAALEAHDAIGKRLALLSEAARSIASPQIRSIGTVGGNLCQRPRCWYYRLEGASCLKKGGKECLSYGGLNKYNAILGGGPSYIVHPSDLAPALVALDADVKLVNAGGERRVALEKFFTLPSEGDVTRETVLASNEILTEVRVPAPPSGLRSTYIKFKERNSFDFALASVALAMVVEGGTVRHARLVLGGVAPVPWRCKSAEALLIGHAPDEATARSVADEALRVAEPLGQNAYKIPLAKALIVRAVRALA
jgi:xanthine dehydrogenase YagS FAD-binding subunit